MVSNMTSGLLSFEYLLVENYKSLSLTESDVTLILLINHLINQNNKFINADSLVLKMAMSKEEIDERLSNLMTRGYVKYVKTLNGMETTIQPLINKLVEMFKIQMAEEREFDVSNAKENEFKSLLLAFQSQFNRSLSPIEISLLKEWVSKGFATDDIVNALHDCVSAGKKSFTAIYNVMMVQAKRKDIQKEGFTARTTSWNKSIDETIEIAKAKWNADESK